MCDLFKQTPATNAGSQFAGAQAADNRLQNQAISDATLTPPKTYQFDPYQANQNAALLSRVQVLQNQQALQQRSPQAYQGQQEAIANIAGGQAGDDQFLRNEALKSGLEQGIANGSVGANSVTSPNSVGGVTTANIFGKDLLNYRNMRSGQQLGLAQLLQPDSAINPQDAISLQEQGKQQAISSDNNYQQYLNNLRFGQATNQEQQTQQALGLSQSNNNAQADALNASRGKALQTGVSIAGTALAAGAVIL